MNQCCDELTYAMYADRELPPEEMVRIREHIATCARCRDLVDSLRAENHAIIASMQALPQDAVEPQADRRSIWRMLWPVLAVLASAALLQAIVSWISGLLLGPAEWLNPAATSGFQNLLFRIGVSFAQQPDAISAAEKALMMIAGVILGAAVLYGLRFVVRKPFGPISVVISLALVMISASSVSAVEHRAANNVTISSGETVNDSLLVHGDTVLLQGNVEGNVFVGGRTVTVNGQVKGNVFFWGQSLDIGGTVQGDVYTFGQSLTISGHVLGNVYIFAGMLEVPTKGEIGRDVFAWCGEVRIDGTVGRDVIGGAGGLDVSGHVGRNVHVSTDHLEVFGNARIGGDLDATVTRQENAHIDPAAVISGKTHVGQKVERSPYSRPRFYFWQVVHLAGALLVGFLLFLILPFLFPARLGGTGRFFALGGIGFLVLIVSPLLAVLVGITLVGIPLAAFILAIWLASMYLAKIVVAGVLGQALAKPAYEKKQFVVGLLYGLVLVYIAINLPYVGGWLSFLILLLGLGIFSTRLWERRRKHAPVPA